MISQSNRRTLLSIQVADPEGRLRDLARGDDHALQALAQMHDRNFEASGLDEETYDLTRMAALTAMGAAPVSWLAHLGATRHHDIPRQRIVGTLIAVAPVVGTARTISAGANIAKALGIAEVVKERLEERLIVVGRVP
jgi:alkylhydroperoxidase/carboxymuconolactone decarboxylase family protein YurZ